MEPEGPLVRKSLPPISILSQMNPFHTFSLYFPKIHSNIILPSTPMSSECAVAQLIQFAFGRWKQT
jgi:hypothetical protein